jgi:glycosyltransferase involved in cell wall biosynthesis
MECMVTVVIPLYNKERYIRNTIASILAQTFRDFEIIVVDDGSTDASSKRVLEFTDPRITLVRQENKGPGRARNVGLALAKGQYISFLDADDEWMPRFLEAAVSYLKDHSCVSVITTGYICMPGGTAGGCPSIRLDGEHEITAKTPIALVRGIEELASLCFSLIRTDVARKWNGCFDKNRCTLGEDMFFYTKLMFNEKIAIIPEPYGIYHTEASDLYGFGFRAISPLEPIFSHADELIAACPPEKQPLLKEYVSIRAMNKSIKYSLLGYGGEARKMLEYCLSRRRFRMKYIFARALSMISLLLPPLRMFRRKLMTLGLRA